MRKLVLVFAAFISINLCASPPSSFTRAKKIAAGIFYFHRETLYCQCQYDQKHRIDLESCHMESAGTHKRAHFVEWEHMVPASTLVGDARCWTKDICTHQDGSKYHGRKCCRSIDKEFRTKEAELYNLWPSNGLINQIRSNFQYAYVPHGASVKGCSFYIDSSNHLAEPNEQAKGVAARASLFMGQKYGVAFSQQQIELFETWDMLYPPSQWERTWAQAVALQEGYTNPFITNHA